MATGKNPSGSEPEKGKNCFSIVGNKIMGNKAENAGISNFGNRNTKYVGKDPKTEKRDKSCKDPTTEEGNSCNDYSVKENIISDNKSKNAGISNFGNSNTEYVRKNGETDSKSSGDHQEPESMEIEIDSESCITD